jgi:two-component sensor histidine kinase
MTDRWVVLVERIRPYSLAALLLGVVALGLATVVRIAFGYLGGNLLFDTYFPAVLVTALLAGAPAGTAVIVGSVIIAWWAFIPPFYEFGELSGADITNGVLFIICSGCIVAVAHLYRDVLHKSRLHDRERDLLMRELEHRGRNTYAVVEAIVRNTLVNDRASADAIAGRVRAVSSANDLVNQSSAQAVQLQTLLSHNFARNEKAQLRASGPDVELSADAARKMGLVFHELVTNAMKHGALSRHGGAVSVQWRAEANRVHLTWREEGGPPVLPPQRQGFGTVIVTESLKSLSGDIVAAFDPDGLKCEITFDCR